MKNIKTYFDLIYDEDFKRIFLEEARKLIAERVSRPNPPPGRRYARDWYDVVQESNIPDYFFKNLEDVWRMTSSLSPNVRKAIKYVGYKAYERFESLMVYEQEPNTIAKGPFEEQN